jgi:uncharacterized protein YaaN involved in tellurite resistance
MGESFNLDRAAGAAARATGVVAGSDVAAAASAERTADSGGDRFGEALIPPQPPAPVDESQAIGSLRLDAATIARLEAMVADYVVAIGQLDLGDERFGGRVTDVRTLGDAEAAASVEAAARLLGRPVGAAKGACLSKNSTLSMSFTGLRKQIDSLDPGHQGDLFGQRKLLGFVSFGDRLQAYFGKVDSSRVHIDALLADIKRGQAELTADNEDLEREKSTLWPTIVRLRQAIYVAQKLDATLTSRLEKLDGTDPERAKALKEGLQAHAEGKARVLIAQLATSVQGYLSIDVIHRNNLELIRGADLAAAATTAAIETAGTVAQAIAALERNRADEAQATEAPEDIVKLQAAFNGVYAILDEIDDYKLKAADSITQTFDTLRSQASTARSLLDRAGGRAVVGAARR